ncbi:MAG: primase C-terminal domain-containing protein [Clostridia bacterium]
MDFLLSTIYKDTMPLKPKRSRKHTVLVKDKYSYGWVYLATKETLTYPDRCRTLSALSYFANENTYITPNSFYHGNSRTKERLRWLNAYVLDFDDLIDPNANIETINPDIVLSLITKSGLPSPTFLNRTSTGVHAWWLFDKPVRAASQKVITLYDSIHRDMIRLTNADPFFTSASQSFVRIPNQVFWSSMNRYTFESFKEWRELQSDSEIAEAKTNVVMLNHGKWVSSPAITALFSKDIGIGQRNSACYTLSLAFKADNKVQDEALNAIIDWNSSLSDPLPYREVMGAVSSAYRGRGSRPSRRYLSYLVGPELAYAKMRYITPPKPRSERSRWHLPEITEIVIQDIFEKKLIEESQAAWAKRLGVPLRSFKLVLAELREAGIIFGITGRGRYAVSYYKLSEAFLKHGKEAILADCEICGYVSAETELSSKASVSYACVVEPVCPVDNNFNGAYSLIQVGRVGVGGSSRSLPRFILQWLTAYSLPGEWQGRGSPDLSYLDTG